MTSWDEMSAADFDRKRMVRGHKRDQADQAGLFYVPTPTKDPAPARKQRAQLEGQTDIFAELEVQS